MSKYSRTGSFWARILNQARNTKGWVVVPRTYSMRTAYQITSDLRNAHKKSNSLRISGFIPGEKWETKWRSPYNKCGKSDYVISIRLVESSPV
jgi:hypothetical protein